MLAHLTWSTFIWVEMVFKMTCSIVWLTVPNGYGSGSMHTSGGHVKCTMLCKIAVPSLCKG